MLLSPPQRPQPWAAKAMFAMAFSLAFLALSLLGAAWTFPHRYAPVSSDFDTGFMGTLAAGSATPLAIVMGNATDETFRGIAITVQERTFFREPFDGRDVRIFAPIVRGCSSTRPIFNPATASSSATRASTI